MTGRRILLVSEVAPTIRARAVRCGADALATMAENEFDCVIVDCALSGWTDLVEEIASHSVPVLCLGNGVDRAIAAISRGAEDYIDRTPASPDLAECVEDVLDRRQARLAAASLRDTLTGLVKEELFARCVEHLLATRSQVALVVVSVDRFGVVNDSLGHDAGDALLREVAARLRALGQPIARLGQDHFAVALTYLGDGVKRACQQLGRQLNGPAKLDDRNLYITCTLGAALAGQGATVQTLVRNANLALHRARREGVPLVVFEDHDLLEMRERLVLEADLRHALDTGQITAAYQPVVDVLTKRVVGAEVLARWHHPVLGEVSPSVFVPLAEDLGLSIEIAHQMLAAGCRQAARWLGQGSVEGDFRVAVNLCASDIVDPVLPFLVSEVLSETGLPPHHLTLEVTESAMIRDTQAALACLNHLRRLGARIAVDDFGTGYSSLSYLKLFPVDMVKIDRSFMTGLGRDADATALVRGILSLAKALGLALVSEGIETEAQLEALEKMGCPLAQGFLWSRAVPAGEFPTMAPVAAHQDGSTSVARVAPEI
jgi:diguanylate cyclase (GGDEF)-like protein